MHNELRMVSPEIIRLRASQAEDQEPHINWFVQYDEEIATDGLRPVVAEIHVVGKRSFGDISVGGLIGPAAGDVELSVEKFVEALADSHALEGLYDFARPALRAILATIESDIVIPRKAPEAEISEFESDDEDADVVSELEQS
jgi:hypothetical protein